MKSEDLKEVQAEAFGGEEEKISALLSSLKRVEAPGDFEFRLSARIAASTPPKPGISGFLSILRYAVPLVLVLAIGSVFLVDRMYTVDNNGVEMIAETSEAIISSPAVIAPNAGVSQNEPLTEPLFNASEPTFAFAPVDSRPALRRAAAKNTVSSKNSGGGSIDRALKVPGKTILPKGIVTEPSRYISKPDGFDNGGEFSAENILLQIGIKAEFDGALWGVRSVMKNSLAERSGIQVGDQVEAIDDRQIDEKTVFTGRLNVNALRIRRSGRTLTIGLK